MSQPSKKIQMILGGAGGLGFAIGQGVGTRLGGGPGGWLGLGVGFALGGLLAYLALRLRYPALEWGSLPLQFAGTGVLIGVVASTACYLGGPVAATIAFWTLVALLLVISLLVAVINKQRAPQQ